MMSSNYLLCAGNNQKYWIYKDTKEKKEEIVTFKLELGNVRDFCFVKDNYSIINIIIDYNFCQLIFI